VGAIDISKSLYFVIPGEPLGYRTASAKGYNKTSARVWEFYNRVRHVVTSCDVPCPLWASKDFPLFFITKAYYTNGHHCDPENTHKGIKDALFWKGKNAKGIHVSGSGAGDKFTSGLYCDPFYDHSWPRVELWIAGHITRKYSHLPNIVDTPSFVDVLTKEKVYDYE